MQLISQQYHVHDFLVDLLELKILQEHIIALCPLSETCLCVPKLKECSKISN